VNFGAGMASGDADSRRGEILPRRARRARRIEGRTLSGTVSDCTRQPGTARQVIEQSETVTPRRGTCGWSLPEGIRRKSAVCPRSGSRHRAWGEARHEQAPGSWAKNRQARVAGGGEHHVFASSAASGLPSPATRANPASDPIPGVPPRSTPGSKPSSAARTGTRHHGPMRATWPRYSFPGS